MESEQVNCSNPFNFVATYGKAESNYFPTEKKLQDTLFNLTIFV